MNSTPQINYRADIDGLRAVAVLAVVLNHLSSSWLPGGYVGVDVFFVISGYLITGIISREMDQGQFTFSRFYDRRARRIFPVLFVVLATTLLASYLLLLPTDMVSTLRGALGTLFFASNIVFWRDMEAGYFAATDTGLNPLLHTWSLAVEEQFYLLFPVLLLLCHRHARQRIVPVLVACAALSLAGAALLVQSKSVAVFFLSPFRAWELLVGALMALNAVPPLRSRMARELAAAAGLLSILLACFVYNGGTTFPGFTALLPVVGAAAIIQAGSSGPSMTSRLLELRPMVFVGLISYSLYLWHWPLIVLTRYAMGLEQITPYLSALFLTSVLLAWISYRVIEQPFRNKATFSQRFVLISTATLTATLTLTACTGLLKDGFESRFSPEVIRMDKLRTEKVPFVDCDGRKPESWCVLGKTDVRPTILLWGDSHLLAWAPAIDQILRTQGISAVFAEMSGCPPILFIQKLRKSCSDNNIAAKDYLIKHPEIKTLLIAAHWSKYFNESNKLWSSREKRLFESGEAQQGLINTLGWLSEINQSVLLIGPVPVYEKDILTHLSISTSLKTHLPLMTSNMQMEMASHFFEAVNSATKNPKLKLINPIDWICSPKCLLIKNNTPLYRDSNHLSTNGALSYKNKLEAALIDAISKSSNQLITVNSD